MIKMFEEKLVNKKMSWKILARFLKVVSTSTKSLTWFQNDIEPIEHTKKAAIQFQGGL
jgi:hypothetical protein